MSNNFNKYYFNISYFPKKLLYTLYELYATCYMSNQENNINDDYENTFDSSQSDNSDSDINRSEIDLLIERVDDMEDTMNKITEQQGNISHKVREQSNRIDDIEETINNIKEEFDELSQQVNVHNGKVNSINSSLDKIEKQLENTQSEIYSTTNNIENRIEVLEDVLELDKTDIAAAIKPNACELEQYATIPEETRKDQFSVRVQRAIAVYENFHEISTPVKSGGQRLLSKDIKTFLNGYSNTNIKYTQVQRVIDSFIEKSGNDYTAINTNDGRAILWKPDKN